MTGEKWPKIEFSGKLGNGVVIPQSSFAFADIIAMVLSDIIFLNKGRYGAKGSPKSSQQG